MSRTRNEAWNYQRLCSPTTAATLGPGPACRATRGPPFAFRDLDAHFREIPRVSAGTISLFQEFQLGGLHALKASTIISYLLWVAWGIWCVFKATCRCFTGMRRRIHTGCAPFSDGSTQTGRGRCRPPGGGCEELGARV